MKSFGSFLSNLRNSSKLSLHDVALLVNSSKSTLSRLENDEIPRPFKTAIRALIIQLAEVLCTSKEEIERYLALAGLDKELLTENEQIRLGFLRYSSTNAPEDARELAVYEQIYEQRVHELATRAARIKNAPPHIQRLIEHDRALLEELRAATQPAGNGQRPLPLPVAHQEPAFTGSTLEKETLLVLNFNHPLTTRQQRQIERLAGTPIGDIIAIPIRIDESKPLAPQITRLVDAAGLDLEDWQRRRVLINPPGYAPAASVLLAELHGRIGHFPTLIRLRPKHASTTHYEAVELLNLQGIRDAARFVNDASHEHSELISNELS
jgi:transcriptional regulator with XRE-family HTH domain